ncbi:hypothetical protein ACOMHN_055291 [Nucella lapillus]
MEEDFTKKRLSGPDLASYEFGVASSNVCLLSEFLARINYLSHSEHRARTIGERVVFDQFFYTKSAGEQAGKAGRKEEAAGFVGGLSSRFPRLDVLHLQEVFDWNYNKTLRKELHKLLIGEETDNRRQVGYVYTTHLQAYEGIVESLHKTVEEEHSSHKRRLQLSRKEEKNDLITIGRWEKQSSQESDDTESETTDSDEDDHLQHQQKQENSSQLPKVVIMHDSVLKEIQHRLSKRPTSLLVS